jgi:hypothetical protein
MYIIISTMDELPEMCYDCPCHNGENSTCNAMKDRMYVSDWRPFWCPLKEVKEVNK